MYWLQCVFIIFLFTFRLLTNNRQVLEFLLINYIHPNKTDCFSMAAYFSKFATRCASNIDAVWREIQVLTKSVK